MEIPWECLASWIWYPDFDDSVNPGQVVLFRREFSLETLPTEFIIHVSADSRYRLFLNCESVSIGPAKGTPLHWYYETVDAAASLRLGRNILAVQVLRYSPAHRGNTSVMRTRLPGFILFAKSQGGQYQLSTDESWVCAIDHSIILDHENKMDSFLSVNEEVHGPSRHFMWQHLDFDHGKWTSATKISHDSPADMIQLSTLPWNLQERKIPQMTDIPRRFSRALTLKVNGSNANAEVRASWDRLLQAGEKVTVPALSEVCADLVAPEYSTGYLCFSFGNGSGSLVRHLSAESYEGVPREGVCAWDAKKGDRMDYKNGHLNGVWDTYTVAGRPLEEYETFWFRAFRIIRLEIITKDEPLSLFDFSYRQTNYPLEILADFSCPASPVFDKFWDVSLRTLRNCMHETYEDCPHYEQSQFAFDTRTQILLTYIVSGDDRLARKALHDFHTSQRPDGLIAMRYPAHTNVVLPGFSLVYPLMVHDHVLYKGDRALAKLYSPTIDAILDHFGRLLDRRGLVGSFKATSWAFVDWVSSWDFGMPLALKEGPGTYFSLIYILALQHAARVANFIGRSELAQEYETRGQDVLAAVNKHCYKAPFYYDGPISDLAEPPHAWVSQHCQVYAVLTGAIQGVEAQELMQRTVEDRSIAPMSTSQLFYLFRALEKSGMYELSRNQWRPWETFLEQNLDTWPEELDVPRSDCHAWSAIPLYEIPCMFLGVQPAASGYSRVKVQPRTDLVDEIEGSVVTPRGLIRVAWKKSSDGSEHELVVRGPIGLPIQIMAQGVNETIDSGYYETLLEARAE